MAIGRNLSDLIRAIGYSFSDEALLENALTHASYSNEYKARGLSLPSNERLEFLGDAVLEIVVSEYLYESYPEAGEGRLTRMRQNIVCERALAGFAVQIGLGEYLHVGRCEEACRERPKVLADATEAVIGAVYLDARRSGKNPEGSVLSIIKPLLSAADTAPRADYKTMLQQFIEKDGSASLEYRIVRETGPEHCKEFTVEVLVNNNTVGEGVAKSKKDAEMKAAKEALLLFGITAE